MSKPVLVMILGLVTGFLAGWLFVDYFQIEQALDQVCIIASLMMFSQLLGATIGGAIGKPKTGHGK